MVLGKGDLLWPDKVSSHFPWLAKLVSQALADKSAEKPRTLWGQCYVSKVGITYCPKKTLSSLSMNEGRV